MNRRASGLVRDGFTLIELLAVMTLIVIMFGTAVGAFFGMKRGASMRAATNGVRAQLSGARETAVARSRTVTLTLTSNSYYSFSMRGNTTVVVQQTTAQWLPRHVYLAEYPSGTPLSQLDLVYKPDGSAGFMTNVTFQILERGGAMGYDVTVQGLTGLTSFQENLP